MRTLTLLMLSFISLNCLYAQQKRSLQQNIYFSNGSSSLDNSALKTLDSISGLLKGSIVTTFMAAGHTDDVGSDIFNTNLSKSRVHMVVGWFSDHIDLTKTRLVADWFGETRPATNDKSPEGRALNRRVEITIEYETPAPPQAEPQEKSGITISELYNRLSLPPQTFCINNSRDTFLVARHGTLIYIKANSIDMLPGYVCDPCITVEVKEAFQKSDIARENLTTMSNDDILVSQSMVYVNFKCDKTSLPLRPGRDYVVFAPTDSLVEAAGIFKGDMDANGNFNWTPDPSSVTQKIPARLIVACNDMHGNFSDRTPWPQPSCDNCNLFFCGIGKWIGGWFSEEGRAASQEYFSCRRRNRAKRSEQTANKLRELYSNNGIPAPRGDTSFAWPCDTITDACGRKTCVSRSLGLKDSLLTRKKIEESIANIRKNGNPGVKDLNDLQYYAYSATSTGWTNIDWMLKYPDSELKTITINFKPSDYTDCKLVFINQRTVLPPQKELEQFTYRLIPRDQPAWLLMIDTRTGSTKIKAELRKIVTGKESVDPVFTEYSLEQFALLLNKMNGN